MKKERFFGIHFDFHAGADAVIGSRTDPEDIAWYIREAKPDFVQCDCKGHGGYSSYPTEVGTPAPQQAADNLKIWVDTVHAHGLPVFVHYSGVWDKAYTQAHPEAAACGEDGLPTEQTSLFGPYCDALLIPQMKELITRYGIDGCWIDGECWAVNRDYSALAKPYLPDGVTYPEHNKIMREAFLRYVQHYTDAIHSFAPDFQIASNWLYTAQVPQKPEIGVDFISGDFTPGNSAHAARFDARCIALQGKPWDLMAWSFCYDEKLGILGAKPAVQLMQEAAVVLTQGGGFQFYITQNRDGSARKERSCRIRQLGEFVRARHINFQKEPLAQVGIFYSAQSRYQQTAADPCVFNPPHACDALQGALNCILDAQYTLNVVMEHQLDSIHNYDILVIPEWTCMSGQTKRQLLAYSEAGGNLVIIGAQLCRQYGELTGTEFGPIQSDAKKAIASTDGYLVNISSDFIDLKSGSGVIYSNADLRDAELPGFRTDAWGKGRITYIPFNLGTAYHRYKVFNVADYLKNILASLAPPAVEINRKNIDLTLQKAEDGLLLNLVNMNQSRHSLEYNVFDQVPTVYDVEVRVNKAYSSVQMPLGEAFTYEIKDNTTVIRLKELQLHSIIMLK